LNPKPDFYYGSLPLFSIFVKIKKKPAMIATSNFSFRYEFQRAFNHKDFSRKLKYRFFTISFFILFLGCSSNAQKAGEWHSFHGFDRTNKSAETGLLKTWPENGPTLKWTASGLGEGYSSVSIAEGNIYSSGTKSGETFVYCFDLEGKLVWEKPNGKPWSTQMSHARAYTGARSTPTYDNGIIYHLGETGRLAAFNAKTGKELWFSDLIERFNVSELEYGYSESVMIDGDYLYVRPAGKTGFQVCLNKNNGELVWANNEIPGVEGYSSPVLMEFGGYSQLINASSDGYYGVDTQTGKLLWYVNWKNRNGLNIPDVIVHDNYVFISSGYGMGSMLVKLTLAGEEIIPEKVWQTELMDNHHGGIILHNGYLYGSGSNARGWFCLDFMTGEQIWKAEGHGKGSVTFAEEMLYTLDERGIMKLVHATPGSHTTAGEFQVPEGGKGMYWAHPVVCGKTLYVRHADKLFAYSIGEN
jgi:outer membrane protein assembly factor BamB